MPPSFIDWPLVRGRASPSGPVHVGYWMFKSHVIVTAEFSLTSTTAACVIPINNILNEITIKEISKIEVIFFVGFLSNYIN
jgi:hypothetical protein